MKALSSVLFLPSFAGFCLAVAVPQSNALLRPVGNRRADTATGATTIPQTDVSLAYDGLNSTANALVHAAMKLPSVLLEDIDAISTVDCSSTGVVLVFDSPAEFEESKSSWPNSDFILFTNHLGDCDAENERGLYVVGEVTFDSASLTATAKTTRTQLKEQADHTYIDFNYTGQATPSKRDITSSVSVDLSGVTLVATDALTITANKATLDSAVTISGHIDYDFLTFKLDDFYMDIDVSSTLNLNVSAAVSASYSTDLINYTPLDVSISAFSIPGIIDVGPMLEFGLGIEFAASGTVNASVDIQSQLADGKVHLDFLDSAKTTTSGWTPTASVATDVDALVELQINPYADLTVAIGVNLFNDLLDLSAGIEAKPEIVNAFAIDVDFEYTSSSGVNFTKPTGDDCKNGAWFASTFHFEVDAFVTQFYSTTLYEVDIPIYESQCWNFIA